LIGLSPERFRIGDGGKKTFHLCGSANSWVLGPLQDAGKNSGAPPDSLHLTQRGPRAQLVQFPKIGHAPALMDPTQIAIIAEFLGP
jgi:hypothetical protein